MVPAADTNVRWENEVVEFAEPAPAVFVPIVVEHRCSVKGALQAVLRTILSEVKVNKPLDKNALRLPGIEGLECVDFIRDVKFKVDADGNRISPEIPYKVPRVTSNIRGGATPPVDPSSLLKLPQDPSPFIKPSRPPTPLWVWILIVSIVVLVTALILAVLRRRKRAAEA
jgi:hypothetical protein